MLSSTCTVPFHFPLFPPKPQPLQASFNFSPTTSGDCIPLASARPEHVAISSMEAGKASSSRGSGDAPIRTPRAIILEPARELAEQVSECLTTFKVGWSLSNAIVEFVVYVDVWGIVEVLFFS